MQTTTHFQNLRLSKQYISKPSKEGFTADDLISAYEQGKVCGKNEIFELAMNTRKQNTYKAIGFCEEAYKSLKNQKIDCGAIFLNDELFNNMFALIIVDEKDYIKDKFLSAIKDLDSLIQNNNEDLFRIHYKVMPFYEDINEDLIVADGYTILYDGKEIKVHRSRES